MTPHEQLRETLIAKPQTWLVTGVAGFIGSNLLETLLAAEQKVVGLDNFSTGKERNLKDVLERFPARQRNRFTLIRGDIRNIETCQSACKGIDYVLHQAARGSVPFSIERPLGSHDSNVTGFLNVLVATRDQHVRRFVFASSSSVYGDDAALPKVENRIGRPLSPYAVTKLANEQYAFAFARNYGLETIGLRYFNVFGARQDPDSAYAAVIPQWIASMIRNEPAYINGDGSTSRDFCYVANVVQANLLSAISSNPAALNEIFNVAVNARHTLNNLFEMLRAKLSPRHPHLQHYEPRHRAFRSGDILHSCADISKATHILGYKPTHTLAEGLDDALDWYVNNLARPDESSPKEWEFESPRRIIGSVLRSELV